MDSDTEKAGAVGIHVGEIVGEPDKKGNSDRVGYFTESLLEDLNNLSPAQLAQKWGQKLAALESERYEDPATGLKVKEAGKILLQREIDIARQNGKDLALVLIDLDGFKQINDTQGHAAGDEAIQILANYLEHQTSRETIACRFGGDEFFLIMPGSPKESALGFSRRTLRELPGQMRAKGFNTTPSIGVSLFRSDTKDSESMMREADEALYTAKEKGKNRVEVFGAEG